MKKLLTLLLSVLALSLTVQANDISDTVQNDGDVNTLINNVDNYLQFTQEYASSNTSVQNLPFDQYTLYSVYIDNHSKYNIGPGPTQSHTGTITTFTTDVFTNVSLDFCAFGFPPVPGFHLQGNTASDEGTSATGNSSSCLPGGIGLLVSLFGDHNYGWALNWGKVQYQWGANAVRYPTGTLTTGDNTFVRTVARVDQADQGGEYILLTWAVAPSTGSAVYPSIPDNSGLNGWKSIP